MVRYETSWWGRGKGWSLSKHHLGGGNEHLKEKLGSTHGGGRIDGEETNIIIMVVKKKRLKLF